jgi:YGGT family
MSNEGGMPEVKSVQREPWQGRRFFSFKATQIILLISGFLEAVIALRIMLKLIGANPESPLAAFIYGFTSLFLIPFVGLIGSPTAGGMILEISSMVAIVVYALIAVAFEKLIWVIFSRPSLAVGVTQTTTSEKPTTP